MTAGTSGHTLVVMPTLNERLNFEPVMQDLDDLGDEHLHVLLVDEDSVDGTWRNYGTNWAADNPRYYLMRRTGRYKGQGSAIRDAIGWAFENENEFQYLAIIAGNGTDDPTFVPALIEALKGGADVVVAQRSAEPGGGPGTPRRRSSGLARLAAGAPLDDVESGFRAFSMAALQSLGHEKLKQSGHGIKLELLARASKAGCRFDSIEVPYTPRSGTVEVHGGDSGAASCLGLALKRFTGLL